MKKILALLLITVTTITFFTCSTEPQMVLQGRTMGTWYTIKVSGVESEYDRNRIEMAVNTALTKVNGSLNTYDPKSEISRFNNYSEPGAFPFSPEFMEVSRTAYMIYERSGGAFDPTVKDLVCLWGFGDEGIYRKPEKDQIKSALDHVGLDKLRIIKNGMIKKDSLVHLDYSAIAKGYGVDLVLDEIALLGYEDILVDIGGEVKVKGKTRTIGIAVPDENNVGNKASAEILKLKNIACATSGDYQQFYVENGERYTHLIDPKTGYPIKHDVTSVTVVAESCMLADAAATAAIVLGKEKGMAFIESLEGVEAFFIYREGDLLKPMQSSGWVW